MHPKNISTSEFFYQLPDEKIAAFPLTERDASKLLIYQHGKISEDVYSNIARHIPSGSLLVFNNTKVIQARIQFRKDTGGVIEIFCLEPYELMNEYSVVMGAKQKVRWKCLVGGAGKWKSGHLEKTTIESDEQIILKAALVEKLPDAYVAEFSWEPAGKSFAEILGLFGDIPLPPYIKRKAENTDKERYQTIYAEHQGSVAAPTAGLHFTPAIFNSLQEKNITPAFVTLHVGAGTFKPVKAATMEGHEMHSEWIDVSAATIDELISKTNEIIAVGTTSLRTLESLYWMGVKTILQSAITPEDLMIRQWDVYEPPLNETASDTEVALIALRQWMKTQELDHIFLPTQILITPGYKYRVAKAIVTNFHQPQSTLLLLVAAAVGDNWKSIYNYALENDFRFLSYGDGSLLFTETEL